MLENETQQEFLKNLKKNGANRSVCICDGVCIRDGEDEVNGQDNNWKCLRGMC